MLIHCLLPRWLPARYLHPCKFPLASTLHHKTYGIPHIVALHIIVPQPSHPQSQVRLPVTSLNLPGPLLTGIPASDDKAATESDIVPRSAVSRSANMGAALSRRFRAKEHWAKPYLSQAILLCAVMVMVATSSILLGVAIFFYKTEQPDNTGGGDQYSCLSQALMQIVASYCTLVPVLQNQISPDSKQKISVVNLSVFYLLVVLSMVTAIATPIVGWQQQWKDSPAASAVLSFASNVFAIITATQLALGIIKLDLKN